MKKQGTLRAVAEGKLEKKIDWEKAAKELAACVIWGLKFMDVRGGSGFVVMNPPGKPMEFLSWEEMFMSALDLVGYKIDRKEFFEQKDGLKKKGKKR